MPRVSTRLKLLLIGLMTAMVGFSSITLYKALTVDESQPGANCARSATNIDVQQFAGNDKTISEAVCTRAD